MTLLDGLLGIGSAALLLIALIFHLTPAFWIALLMLGLWRIFAQVFD